MATTNLTVSSFEPTISADGIVLVDFWADWCGPCTQFAPVYETVSEQHPDVTFGKVDTEVERELAAAAGISSIPTLMAFRDGIAVFAQAGALPPAALEQVVQAVRDLDMDDVRAQVEAQQAMAEKPLEVSADDFARLYAEGELTLVDVREPAEYRAGHLPGAELVPMRAVADKAAELPRDEPVYVICASGNRSRSLTEVLRRAGVEAYSVAGGTQGWATGAPGRDLVEGAFPTAQPA